MALPQRRTEGWVAAGVGALLPLSFLAQDRLLIPFTMIVAIFLVALMILFRFKDIRDAGSETAFLLMGFAYVALPLGHMVLLYALPDGVKWIFLMLTIVMMGDSAAYYLGTAFGKRRLYPEVSPKKSIEGALGGLAGSIVGAFLVRLLYFPALTPVDCVAAALILGILGQLGDLFESLLKRSFGVKDSGNMVPGHGGILDRLDSILFAAPAAYYYVMFFFKAN